MPELYEKQIEFLMESDAIENISCSLQENIETLLIQCLKKSNAPLILLCKNVENFGFNKRVLPFLINSICCKEIDFKILSKESFSPKYRTAKIKTDLYTLSKMRPNLKIYNLPKNFKFDAELFFSLENDKFFIVKTPEYSRAFFNYSRHKEINEIIRQVLELEKNIKTKKRLKK